MTSSIDLTFEDRADLRSNAVDRLHTKTMRARYKIIDAATLNRHNDTWSYEDGESLTPRRRELLNKRKIHSQLKRDPRSRSHSCLSCDKPLNHVVRNNKHIRYDEEIAMARNPDEGRCCPCCMESLMFDSELADVTYSYDHATGPSYGSDILSQALNQAVVRFEAKELDKLVKSEYDVVQADEDHGSSSDDEFELV